MDATKLHALVDGLSLHIILNPKADLNEARAALHAHLAERVVLPIPNLINHGVVDARCPTSGAGTTTC
ncbi:MULTISPECIES: TetR family transcriptional regulator C-terminal domain-containing protein [Curtobacterium]|uniref:TetR family transcriptional regulator C-terminal domain-containing protein n=1 Tax=Curtobacterium TaxID=2034 RepID=UPI0034DB252C